MKRQAAVLVAILMVISQVAAAQSTVDTPRGQVLTVSPFLGQDAAIPEGYSLRLSAAYPPYERTWNSACGNITVGIAGLLEATLSREDGIGSPVGLLKPNNFLGFRLQVIPQREHFPAVSIFLTTMTESQSEFLGGSDLQPNVPEIFQRGLVATSYQARTTLSGVALSTALSDLLSFNVALGGRQIVWQQRWSAYTFNPGFPGAQGWTFPLAERTRVRFDISASASFRPIPELAFIGEIASLPFIDVDPSSLVLEARQGYIGAIGVRYYLPIPLSVDLYDRWYSETGDRTNYHQMRFGLSTDIQFQ